MKLHVIASSSAGNAYVLDDEAGSQLLLECGVQYPRIQEALNFDFSKVSGCLVTHEHQDHCKSIKNVIKAGIDSFLSEGTISALELKSHRIKPVKAGELFDVGAYKVLPFNTEHDAVEPLGWLIKHKITGEKLVFATDTYYVRHRFEGVNYFMLECNYCANILEANIEAGLTNSARANRLLTSHFELNRVIDLLKASADSAMKKIIPLHLSSENSDAKRMRREIQCAIHCETIVAEPGLVIDFSDTPF